MAEQKLHSLAEIVHDLWGTSGEAPAEEAAAKATAEYRSAFPPFEQLWKTADDTVDWTEALAHEKPNDGLTSAHLWGFFHQYADRVLQGDLTAYVEVLKTANPLGDLTSFVSSFHLRAVDADELAVKFQAHPAYLTRGKAETHRYLCAVALRSARDLMALLPVCRVAVTAVQGEKTLLQVVYDREEMQKVRFSFVDPVTFAAGHGAVFHDGGEQA